METIKLMVRCPDGRVETVTIPEQLHGETWYDALRRKYTGCELLIVGGGGAAPGALATAGSGGSGLPHEGDSGRVKVLSEELHTADVFVPPTPETYTPICIGAGGGSGPEPSVRGTPDGPIDALPGGDMKYAATDRLELYKEDPREAQIGAMRRLLHKAYLKLHKDHPELGEQIGEALGTPGVEMGSPSGAVFISVTATNAYDEDAIYVEMHKPWGYSMLMPRRLAGDVADAINEVLGRRNEELEDAVVAAEEAMKRSDGASILDYIGKGTRVGGVWREVIERRAKLLRSPHL